MIVAVLVPVGLFGLSRVIRRRVLEMRAERSESISTEPPTSPPPGKGKKVGGIDPITESRSFVARVEDLPEYIGSASQLHDEIDKSEPSFDPGTAVLIRDAREEMVWYLTHCCPEGSYAIQEILITAFTARNCLLGYNEHFIRDEFFIHVLLSELSDLAEAAIKKASLSEEQLTVGLRSLLFLVRICKEPIVIQIRNFA